MGILIKLTWLRCRAWGGGRGQKASRGSSQWSRRERMVVWTTTVAMGGKRWAPCKALLLWWMRWAGRNALKTNVTIPRSYGRDREPAGAVQAILRSLHIFAPESHQRPRKLCAGPSPSCTHTSQPFSGCPGGVMSNLPRMDLPLFPPGHCGDLDV